MPGIFGFTRAPDASPEEDRRTLYRMADLLGAPVRDAVVSGPLAAARCGCRTSAARGPEGPGLWLHGSCSAPPPGRDDPAGWFAGGGGKRPGDADGAFAVAALCGGVLHLLTDRFGLRPLHVVSTRAGLAWASEAKAFLALPGFSPRIDESALCDFLSVGYLLEDRTWLDGVRRLAPATRLVFRPGARGVRERSWLPDTPAPPLPEDADTAAGELARLLVPAVRRRVDRRTGLFLSGGLDSRALLAALDDPASVPAFTFGPDGSDADIAARAARAAGASHRRLRTTGENWLRNRAAALWRVDGMLDLFHMHGVEHFPTIGGEVDAVLSGAGGDGVIGGGHLFPEKALDAHIRTRLHVDHPETREALRREFRAAGSAHAFYLRSRVRNFTLYGTLTAAGFGFDVRLPLLDRDLQDFLARVPLSLRKDNALYRRALLRAFPALFASIPWAYTGVPVSWPLPMARLRNALLRRLRPFSRPPGPADWLRRPPGAGLLSLLSREDALCRAYLPSARIRAALDAHAAGSPRIDELGRLLTFELYLNQLFDRRFRKTLDLATS